MHTALLLALILQQPPAQPPRPGSDGPRAHQIHFATSDDGLAFTAGAEPVMVHASVPDLIELSGAGAAGARGTLVIYTVDARSFRGPGTERLARLVSTDAGKTWSEPEVITISGAPTAGALVDPSVVQLPDGRLRLYYYLMASMDERRFPALPQPSPGPRPQPELPRTPDQPRLPKIPTIIPPAPAPQPEPPARPLNQPPPHQIYSAISDDGVSFTIEDGVRFESQGITDPEVVFCPLTADGVGDGDWLMFLSHGQSVTLARSKDGLRFEADGVFRLDGGGVPGALVLPDGRVRVFQSGREGITSAVYNPRTQTITPEPGTRVEGRAADPAVCARAAGGYAMVIKRWIGPSGPP